MSLNGKFYLLGAIRIGAAFIDGNTYEYDPAADRWTAVGRMGTPRGPIIRPLRNCANYRQCAGLHLPFASLRIGYSRHSLRGRPAHSRGASVTAPVMRALKVWPRAHQAKSRIAGDRVVGSFNRTEFIVRCLKLNLA
jgi:hypothetical protein